MPRFSKPVTENEQGEWILPGAYEAAPGGVCERRATFEWDNHDRALINVEELGIELSDDDEDEEQQEVGAEGAGVEGGVDNDSDGEEQNHPQSNRTVVEEADQQDSGSDVEQGLDLNQPATGSGSEDTRARTHSESQGEQQEERPLSQAAASSSSSSSASHNSSSRSTSSSMISAVAVEDEEEEETTPGRLVRRVFCCTQSDWQSKRQHQQHRPYKTLIWPLAGIFLGTAIVLGAVLAWDYSRQQHHQKRQRGPAKHPFAPPTPELAYRQETSGIQGVIETFIIDQDKLKPNWQSPYFQALYWMLFEDPLLLSEDDEEMDNNNPAIIIQQRYLMALFYFSTSQLPQNNNNNNPHQSDAANIKPSYSTSSWRHCAAVPPFTVHPDDDESSHVQQQQQLCTHEEIISWSPRRYKSYPNSYRWLSGTSECDWAGVTCNDVGHVISVQLHNYGLVGTLLPELAPLVTTLQTLSLPYHDNLKGPLPTWLQQLTRLELQYNQHTGTIFGDDNVGDDTTSSSPLQTLNLARNQFTGTLSKNVLKSWTSLQELYLQDNAGLSGTLPHQEIQYMMSNLQQLNLMRNQFSGTLPSTMFSSAATTHLVNIDLSDNSWTGTIPSELSFSPQLTSLRLANAQLEGSIPLSLFDKGHRNLQRLDLQNNNLEGTLSSAIGQLTNLKELKLQDNFFSGTLPPQLGQLSNMGEFDIHGNDFVGMVPTEFCALGVDDWPLAFSVEVVVDCSPGSGLTCPEGCCGTCCSKVTGDCSDNSLAVLGFSDGKSP